MATSIPIYEPLYQPGQIQNDPAFLPLDRLDNGRPEWREFGIYVDLYREGRHRGQALTGVMSPRFRLKTGKTGAEFISFIEANPGADVYIINPFPQYAYTSFN